MNRLYYEVLAGISVMRFGQSWNLLGDVEESTNSRAPCGY
jgi:hypothetical protein